MQKMIAKHRIVRLAVIHELVVLIRFLPLRMQLLYRIGDADDEFVIVNRLKNIIRSL
ncbi:hypothetical protein D3C84_1145080 [compost metagenome]